MAERSKSDVKNSLGLYVHVPFCEGKCKYCGFYSEVVEDSPEETGDRSQETGGRTKSEIRNSKSETISNGRSCNVQNEEAGEACLAPTGERGGGSNIVGDVIDAMVREMEGYDLSGADTVYVGGGSPSAIPEEELVRLLECIRSMQNGVRPREEKGSDPILKVEFTVEVNPGQVTEEKLRKMRAVGVNRLSMGAQSFDDGELAFLGRRHKAADVIRSVVAARKAGFANISVDLIFAIPGSSVASWEKSLRIATALGVEHISAYALTYEAGTPLHAARERGEIVPVDEELDRAMYEAAIDILGAAGYGQYEISNFARAGFECRHNHKYWANDEYVGIGPAAASWYDGARCSNVASIDQYLESMKTGQSARVDEHRPDAKEVACETAVLNLRRIKGIELEEYKKRTGFDAMELFGDIIRRYEMAGMLKVEEGRVFLTREALPIADSVLCDFASVE